jgi:hypothetical protein
MTDEEEARKRLYDDILREFVERVLIVASARLSEDVLLLMQQPRDAFHNYTLELSVMVRTGLDAILTARGIEEITTNFWLAAYVLTGEYLNGALPRGCPYTFVVFEETLHTGAIRFMLTFGERSMFPELTGNTNPRTVPVRRIDDRADPNSFTRTN